MSDFEIFEGKTLSSLFKDIHDNSVEKKDQIEVLIKKLEPLIKNIGDATIVVPLIKEYLDVSVKNDEQLIKIAGIVGRILQAEMKGVNDEGLLTDLEKEQLMKALEDEVSSIQLESDKIKNQKKNVDDKISKYDKN